MNIAGVGLEQDVAMENVDMKTWPETGAAGMAGFAASPHHLYFVILSVFRAVCGSIFGRLQAVGRYVRHPLGRRADRPPVLLLPTLCLALAFVFFNAVGAMAQIECPPPGGTQVPTVSFESPIGRTHDGSTPVTMAVVFSVVVSGFTKDGIKVAAQSGGDPTISDVVQDSSNMRRYTFTLTPMAKADFVVSIMADSAADVNCNYNFGDTQGGVTVSYVAPALVAEAGDPQTVASGASVTLAGSGTETEDSRTVTYAWTRTDGTSTATVPLTGANTLTPTFTADTLAAGADSVTHIFTLRVTDNQGSTAATDMVTITVISALVAEAGDPQTVASGAPVTLAGSGTETDSSRTVTYAWTRTDGTSTATVSLTGANTLTPTFTADTLAADADSVTHIFTLRVTDNQGSTAVTDMVTVTVISGLVAEAGDPQTVASGAPVTLAGSGTETDSSRTVTYAWTRTDGTSTATVSLTGANTLTPTFTADTLAADADSVTHIFTLRVTDNQGSTAATDMVTITVISALVAEAGDPQTVASGAPVTLAGSGTETDSSRTVTYAWTRTDGTSTATVSLTGANTLTPTFTADTLAADADSVTHIFTLRVTDNQGSTAVTDMVTVTVISGLVAEAGDPQTVASGAPVTLAGSGTETDSSRTVTYAWTRTDGTSTATVSLTGANTLTPTFTADTLAADADSVTHIFTLRVTDNQGSTAATDMVTITVISALVAEAGDPQTVASGAPVTLAGSGTETDSSRTVTYAWTRTDGTSTATVSLTGANTLTPTFTADTLAADADSVTHIFTLRVTDNQGSTAVTDMVTVTVISGLVAEAGDPQTVASGAPVTLAGSGTETDSSRTVTYAWTRTDGTSTATVSLTGANTLTPTFTADTLAADADSVTHIFTLRVTDNQGSTAATDMVTITVISALVAEAGDPQTVASGAPVTLAGSGTETDSSRTVTYAWTRTDGTSTATVSLTGANTLTPTFTADTLAADADSVTHIFTLRVTDNQGSTAVTDMVTVTVISGLVAEAGDPQTVASGAPVTLAGSGTETDSSRTVTYAWTRTDGTSTATVSLTGANTLTPTFTADTLAADADSVTHIFTLRVTDNQGSTAVTDMVTVTVISGLVAEAGDPQTVASGAPVTLAGSGTETDSSRTVTYAWTRTDGTSTATVSLTGANTLTPTFTADTLAAGADSVTHIFTLRVTDNQGSTAATDTVTITVISGLVAEAGAPQTVASGAPVTLAGSGTETDSSRTVIYAWTQTGGDAATVTLIGANTLQPTFTAQTLNPGDADVTYEFTLTVSDNQSSAPATDTVTVTVTAVSVDIVVSPSDLKVQEGGSGTYRVRLRESPGREVIIMADSGNEPVVRLKNTRLVFNADNWNDWQEVEIDAVADSVKKGDSIEVTIRHSLNGVASNKFAVVTVSVRAQEDDPILDHVGQFIATRATTLLGQQPDLIHFLKQDGLTQDSGGSFTFQATDGRLSLDGGFIHDGTWGEVTGARTNSESTDTKSVLGSFGIHRKYSETFLTGLMLQFDRADHELPQQTGTIDGTGWLVGPYFVARHGSQPLYFEGRLLYGYSDNDIRFMDRHLGARTGSFDSTRVLAQIRVEGEIAVPGWDHGDDGGAEVPQLIPYADLRWLEDRAAAFTTVSATTGFRVPVPGQTVNISQLELGSNMVVPVAVPTGSMILTGGLGLVFSNTEGNHIKSDAHGRGRGEIGFSYGLDENVQIDFESFYDGIGSSGYEGYGLSLNAEMRF